jgi:DNA-binding NtrC family response regulator
VADVLVIDDQDRYIELCRKAIPGHRYRGPARSWREAAETLARARGRVDLVLLDVNFDIPAEELLGWTDSTTDDQLRRLRRRQGLHILGALRARHPDLPVILMTSREELALEHHAEEMNAEEYTYFLDDDYVDARSLEGQISGIVAARRGDLADGPVYWGRTLAMRRLRQRLEVLARGRLPVVLLGPTGTGKSLLARHFVHQRSERPGRFVAVDLSTVPRDLMAAHLFGSVRGAYTGSVADRIGAFEQADRGTLFLDEVGNLPLDAQKILLTVLQEGLVTRVGDLKERSVDVKVVVATNDDLVARVRAGTFRSDLYMRLNPATAVTLPSLADRALDMDALLAHCLERALERPTLASMVQDYRARHGIGAGPVAVLAGVAVPEMHPGVLVFLFPTRAMRLLRAHNWPGNLREFSMVAENAVLFALAELSGVRGGDRADIIQVRPKLVRDLLRAASMGSEGADASGWSAAVTIEPQETLNKVAQSCERQYFERLYVEKGGDFSAMAEVLLGDEAAGRKVQLRLNQLGLKVRELKERLR